MAFLKHCFPNLFSSILLWLHKTCTRYIRYCVCINAFIQGTGLPGWYAGWKVTRFQISQSCENFKFRSCYSSN